MLINKRFGRLSATQSGFAAIALLLVFSVFVDGQTGAGMNKIQGRVHFPSNSPAVSIRVRLENPNNATMITVTDSEGVFSFNGLDAGTFMIIIEAGEEYEIFRETVLIDPPVIVNRNVYIRPAPRTFNIVADLRFKGSVKNKPGVINASLAAVPKPALKEFKKAIEAENKGETNLAIEKLNEAVKLHPQFAEAHTELGALYLKTKQLDKAEPALRKALELDAKNLKARLNFGIVLLNKKDMEGAERELREAAKGDETAATPHLYLGIALVGLNRYEDAEKEFLRTIEIKDDEKTAQAHYYLGGIYWQFKKYSQAADELEKYLKLLPKIASAEKIRETIKQLRAQAN